MEINSLSTLYFEPGMGTCACFKKVPTVQPKFHPHSIFAYKAKAFMSDYHSFDYFDTSLCIMEPRNRWNIKGYILTLNFPWRSCTVDTVEKGLTRQHLQSLGHQQNPLMHSHFFKINLFCLAVGILVKNLTKVWTFGMGIFYKIIWHAWSEKKLMTFRRIFKTALNREY